jgi:hypothetical protein
MKQSTMFLVCVVLLMAMTAFLPAPASAQVAGLAFSTSSGTYTPLSGATVLTTSNTWDDSPNYTAPIGFTFNLNGVDYTQVGVAMNGFITFGATAPGTSNYAPISSTTAYAAAVSAFGRDLQGVTALGEISYLSSGGVFTVQWAHARRYNGTTVNTEDFSFQIKLYQTTNKIEIVYGSFTDAVSATSTSLPQVGLRGATNADFNDLEVLSTGAWATPTAGSTNASTCYYNEVAATIKPASGLTYTWQPLAQSYVSSTVTQNTAALPRGTTNQQIIGIQVVMLGAATPLNITQFNLNTTGTTSTSDISNAKLFYTGTSNVFATTTQFGSTVAVPSGAYTVAGTQALSNGINYFWLTYDIPAGATINNFVDGECTSITLTDGAHTPSVTAPAGNRQIKAPLAGTYTINNTVPTGGTNFISFADAVTTLNALGFSAAVTFNVSAGQTFVDSLTISSPGTAVNTITFQKSGAGANPVIQRYGTTGTADAIVTLNGADYVTFDGIDLANGSGSTATEWGYYLVGSATDGAQHNTIKNCTVTLSNANTASRGVYVLSAATAAGGANSANKFYNNTINYCYSGYYFAGVSAFPDDANEVGIISAGTSTISNLAGGSSGAYGVYFSNQTTGKVFSTTINNMVIHSAGSGFIYGIYSIGTLNTVDIYSNEINTMIDSSSSGYSPYGIYVSSGTTTNIYQNTVHGLTSSAYYAYGIYVAGGTTNNVYRNNVYDVSYTGTSSSYYAIGIYLSSGTTNNVYNNMIADIKAPAGANTTAAAAGIYASGGTTDNIYYNSVLLNYVSTSASNTSAAFVASSTPTTIDLRNNIFVNNVDVTTGTRAVAFRRTTTGFTNISSTTNNNLYYAGTPGATHLLFYDGTNSAQTLAAYKTLISTKDQSAVTENPAFLSVVAPYDLHLNTGTPTQCESGGLPVTTPIAVTNDYDGNTRNATTPDIGADEGIFPGLDINAPAMTYTPFLNSATIANRILPVVITDVSGVPTTGTLRPRIYYRKNSGTWYSQPGTLASGSATNGNWNFTVVVADMGGVVAGDTVRYYTIAQDIAGTPNIGSNPSGVVATDVNTVTTPPTPNAYVVVGSISGVKTVGASGADYPTLTAAVADLNNKELVGALTFNLIDAAYASETFPITIAANAGSSSTNRVTIKPATGVTATISGSSASALIKLNGADYVTIDGSNAGATDRSLTLSNTSTAASTEALWVSSLGTAAGAANVTIKNCVIATGVGTTASTYGIYASGDDNDNLTIQNNDFSKAYYGIYAYASSTGLNNNLTIVGNSIGSNTVANQIGYTGIYVAYATGASISQNYIYKIAGTINTPVGISLNTGVVSSSVTRNNIEDITYTGTAGYGGRGIYVSTGDPASALTIANNEVSVIGGDGYTSFSNSSPVGMYLDGTMAGLNIYYNSVYMTGSLTYSAATITTAFLVNSSVTGIDLRNNVFMNDMVNSANTSALNYAIYSYPTTTPFTTINYNDYYVSGTQGMLGRFNGVNDTTLTAWRAATGQDVNSINSLPMFFSTRNLQPYLGSNLLAAGTPIGTVTNDILGVTRNATHPSIGAYEAGLAVGPPNPALVVAPADSATGIARAATLNWADGGGGATGYKLYFGTDNPPTNIVNGTNLGLVLTYTPASLMTYGTTYYWKIVPTNGMGDATGCPIWRFTIQPDPTITTFPYAEGFESTTFPPLGWSSVILSGTYNWIRTTAGTYPTQLPYSGVGEAEFQSFSASSGYHARLITPPMNLVAGLGVSFQMYHDPGYTTNFDSVSVEITTDAGTTWTSLGSYIRYAATAGWVQHTVSLAGYTGTANIAFHAWSLYGNNMFIDSVRVEVGAVKDIAVTSVAINPTFISVGMPVTVSAVIKNLGSEANPTSVPLTYKLNGMPASQGDGTGQVFTPSWTGNTATVTFTTTFNPANTGSLSLGVRSFYAGDERASNDSVSMTTTVYPAGTLLAESFDPTTFPPTGWVLQNLGSGNSWTRGTANTHSGAGVAQYLYNSSAAANTWLISRGVALTAGTQYRISYWYKVASATYPENMAVAMGTVDSAAYMTTVLADHPSLVNESYAQNAVRFTPSSSGTYYFGFHCYSLADQYDLYLDDVVVSLVPAVDMSMTDFYQASGIPYPTAAKSFTLAPPKKNQGDVVTIETRLDKNGVGSRGSAANASVVKTVQNQFDNAMYLPVSVKGVVANLGLNASTWTMNWYVEGAAQSPVSRPSVASGATDTASASYTSSNPGTFWAYGKAVASGDGDNSNDSLGGRIRIYPDSYNRTMYDRGDDTVDTFIGWGSTTTQMKAGVRFTATVANRRLAGVDFITRSETAASTGIWQVQVCAAGVTDSVPGAVLYTRLYSGLAYNAADGDYMTFPFDNTAPTFNVGENYWITVKAPLGISYPGAAHNTGFTSGRSFYESNTDTTAWIPLVITTERAWIMRSYDIPTSTTTTLNVALASGWNLISNPVTNPVPGDSVRQLFPTSVNAYAFEFAAGYTQKYRLANGKGYWEKFPAAASNSITGTPRTRDSIAVSAGWNIIGSISNTVDTSTIVSVPPGIRASAWFAYAAGYTQTTQIVPGKGYWVKASAAGKFVFANPLTAPAKTEGGVSAADILHSVTITDANGNAQTLYFGADANNELPLAMYDMPPAPPTGAFDARFESNEGGTMVKAHAAKVDGPVEFTIDVMSAAYPLTVTWNVNGGTAAYQLGDGNGGKSFASREMVGEGSIKVTNSSVTKLSIKLIGDGQLPAEFALNQNYPNPFNPTTNIRYALPVDSKLTMEVYNVLGQRVRTLVNTDMVAGYHEVEWNGLSSDGQQLASGVYFLQMAAKGTNGKSFSDVRKLMLLK